MDFNGIKNYIEKIIYQTDLKISHIVYKKQRDKLVTIIEIFLS